MKAIFLPNAILCGVCGCVMLIKRNTEATPSTTATVYCAMLTCPERRKRYTLELETRELQPLPTVEAEEPAA